jgi:hypothetical protein
MLIDVVRQIIFVGSSKPDHSTARAWLKRSAESRGRRPKRWNSRTRSDKQLGCGAPADFPCGQRSQSSRVLPLKLALGFERNANEEYKNEQLTRALFTYLGVSTPGKSFITGKVRTGMIRFRCSSGRRTHHRD